MNRRIQITPGTPLASLIGEADAAFERGDVQGIDKAYRRAVASAGNDAVRSALAVDHIGQVLAGGGVTLALERCEKYLSDGTADEIDLLLLRAEARGAAGNHDGADADAAWVRPALGARSMSLSDNDHGRLLRVEGLAAADHGDLASATRMLADARRRFRAADEPRYVAVIDVDLMLLDVRQGDKEAVARVLAEPVPKTTAGRLLLATALKRELRYEEAYRVLEPAITAPDLDSAHRVPVLGQLIVLAWLTCQDEKAERLIGLLRHTTAASRDASVAKLLARLDQSAPPSAQPESISSESFTQVVQDARRLLDADSLDTDQLLRSVESLLVRSHPAAATIRDEATWHLAAGELCLMRHQRSGESSALQSAISHLDYTVTLVEGNSDNSLIEIRILALRRLGRAFARCADRGRHAAWCWGEAHRLEEDVAARQVTDEVRIGMLLAAPDEHDERIRAATGLMAGHGQRAAAGIAVAMEAARGATILGAVLPANTTRIRQLPSLGDIKGALRWLHRITNFMPRSQAVWLLHATPDHVHHAIIYRGCRGVLLHHLHVPVRRARLEEAVNDLTSCWDPAFLEASVHSGEFDQALANIAELIAIGDVVRQMPKHVHRIATVAGGALADIPVAALTVPGDPSGPLARRYAFSDLPCLSTRAPLHHRSRRQRGDLTLLVSPPGDGLTTLTITRGPDLLPGTEATPQALRAKLKFRSHRRVRIDAHGQHDQDDPARSWMQLAPEGNAGRLSPDMLQSMDLHGCGTFIVGACESGMAHRIGRDERAGFVRAGMHAGSAAVVAARWIADDPVAAAILDRFERYLRYLPRDLALRQAQLDVCDGTAGLPGDPADYSHPARWACWALYGDSGWQASAGPLRRHLRRHLDQRRNHA